MLLGIILFHEGYIENAHNQPVKYLRFELLHGPVLANRNTSKINIESVPYISFWVPGNDPKMTNGSLLNG